VLLSKVENGTQPSNKRDTATNAVIFQIGMNSSYAIRKYGALEYLHHLDSLDNRPILSYLPIMKLLVCGGRDFDDVEFIVSRLNRLYKNRPITELIHGAAKGADTISGLWAEEMGIPVRVFPADWKTHGRGAGHIRNHQMLNESRPDALFAFPGGKGTANMIEQAEKKLPEVWVSNWLFFEKKDNPQSRFLSNFATGYQFTDDDGITWSTTEHYYQAMKSPLESEQDYVREAPTPGIAKKRGRQITCYRDWDRRKDDVMRRALAYKFAPGTRAAQLLLDTHMDYLVEYAPWGDTYWGVDANKEGLNMLGKLLMERRDLLPLN